MALKRDYPWPIDLRVFGALSLLWSLYLVWVAAIGNPFASYIAPARALIGGNVFYGAHAQLVLLIEAGIFWVIAVGMITGRRWGLVLSLFYMAQSVISHLVFIIAYMDTRSEWVHVEAAVREGSVIVLLTLYLWIRAREVIFDLPKHPSRPWPE